ncbi:MAG: hypothetical protein HC942_12395 [Microcoleus sp. SU_5_6]|nr:hypothetical protein [Microcoleus sp. SU_5_6]
MNGRFLMGIEKDLQFDLKNKGFLFPIFTIADFGFGWVDRARGFELISTQPVPVPKNRIRHRSLAISSEPPIDN